MTEKEKRDNGELYDANYDKSLKEEMLKAKELCFKYNNLEPTKQNDREKLIKDILGKTKENLLQDKELLLAGLKQSGQILYFASKEMRDDKEVVLEAVKNKPIIIKFASNRLREDKEIGITAMKTSKKCYEFLGENLKKDEDILAILNEQ